MVPVRRVMGPAAVIWNTGVHVHCQRHSRRLVMALLLAIAPGVLAPVQACGLEPTYKGGLTVSYPGALDVAVAVADSRRSGLLPPENPGTVSSEVLLQQMLADLRQLESRLDASLARNEEDSVTPFTGSHWARPVVALSSDTRRNPGGVPLPSRPRGTAYHLGGVYLMRVGQALNPMSEDQLRQIFSEGGPDWFEEQSKGDLTTQEVVDLLDTQTYFELLKLPYPTGQVGVVERLLNDHLVDELGNTYSIRRLGALLLAKRLEDFPDLARKAPRVVVYTGTSKLATRLDQAGIKGYAVGFQGLVHFVMSQLPQNEVVEAAIRKEVKLIPEIAIRELVANALIHQDFTIGGTSMMVEIYTDRVEISNPGEPIVPVERFIDGYESRNEDLARMMRRLGICEEKSSGIDRVVREAEVYQLPAPDFRAGHKRTVVTIYGPRDFEQMDRGDRTRACYQHCVLKWVMSERMTNQSLRDRFGLPESKSAIVSQVIAAAMEAGLIKADEKVGASRRFARYLPFWA